jgi:integrase
MTSSEKQSRFEIAKEKVIENNENQIVVSVQQITDFKDNLLSPKFKIIPAIIMAQLSSGCRLIEILSSEFNFEESKTEGYILQSNVAKNRTDNDRPVEKPVLFMTVENFLKLMKIIRSRMTHKEGDDNITLSNRYDKRVNTKVKKLGLEVGMSPEISSSHDLRRLYANYSHMKFASPNCSLQCWISKVLGHADLTSTANYSTVKII